MKLTSCELATLKALAGHPVRANILPTNIVRKLELNGFVKSFCKQDGIYIEATLKGKVARRGR